MNSLLKIDENFDIEEKMTVILLIIKRQPQLNIICIHTQGTPFLEIVRLIRNQRWLFDASLIQLWHLQTEFKH